MTFRIASVLLMLALISAACQRDTPRVGTATAPAAANTGATTAAPTPAGDELSGQVVETMNAAGYTYARLERNGKSIWIAGMETKLAVGTKLGRMSGSLMKEFRSNAMQRTFPEIYFINEFVTADGKPLAAAPAPAEPAAAAPAPAAGQPELAGVIVETMNAGGYTYALLERDGKKTWVAGPETALKMGAQLPAMQGTAMSNFRSDTLKRTFDVIYFVAAFSSGTAAPINPHGAPPVAADKVEAIAPAAGGITVAALYQGKTTLAGKPAVVRGKVVKVNNGILGRNWVHLRDGTGAAGSNDLLVTSQTVVKAGDVVVARGTVTLDKDFGSGYRYDVLLEDAALEAK
jgi:GW (Gly-Tryp) dipeptide domain